MSFCRQIFTRSGNGGKQWESQPEVWLFPTSRILFAFDIEVLRTPYRDCVRAVYFFSIALLSLNFIFSPLYSLVYFAFFIPPPERFYSLPPHTRLYLMGLVWFYCWKSSFTLSIRPCLLLRTTVATHKTPTPGPLLTPPKLFGPLRSL